VTQPPALREVLRERLQDPEAVTRFDRTFSDQLQSANAAFSTPKTLHVKDDGLVDLRVSTDQSIDTLKSQLVHEAAQEGVQIQASATMEAALTGGAFKIQEITAPRQAVGAAVTEWKWEVEPTRAGRLPLHLALTAFVSVDGQEAQYGVRTFDRTLQVESVPVALPTRVADFLGENWAWIAGILGLLAGGAKALLSWERRRPPAAKPTTDRAAPRRGRRSVDPTPSNASTRRSRPRRRASTRRTR
jgi:hypothetical protein